MFGKAWRFQAIDWEMFADSKTFVCKKLAARRPDFTLTARVNN
jgi:hypothetical protein